MAVKWGPWSLPITSGKSNCVIIIIIIIIIIFYEDTHITEVLLSTRL